MAVACPRQPGLEPVRPSLRFHVPHAQERIMAMPPSAADSPATRDRRRAIFARAPLTAAISEPHRAALLAASSLKTCAAGTVLMTPGQTPHEVYLIGSGFVQVRVCINAGLPGDIEPGQDMRALHWHLLGEGDLVVDRELASLVAGVADNAPRRNTASVIGEAAEIVFIQQQALAGVLREDETARRHLATDLTRALESLTRLTGELATLKNFGKARLARFLLELFDRMGRMRNGQIELAQEFSHADLASLLGLTRRSVFDDLTALEDFDAVDHDRTGRLSLRNRARLMRIAGLGQDSDRDIAAESWRADIEAAFAAGDTALALEFAREALLYHPRESGFRYDATLAALRAGALAEAGRMIEAFGFAGGGGTEAEAALAARAAKERAFSSLTRETLAARAAEAAQVYLSVHGRTGGTYPALNAAAMFAIAGSPASATLASQVLQAMGRTKHGAYWDLATVAEAHWLLGDAGAARAAAERAHAAPDADDGRRCTTRKQFRRLAAALGRSAAGILDVLPVAPVIVCPTPPTPREAALLSSGGPARVLAVVADAASAQSVAALGLPGLELIMANPGAGDASAFAQARCHLAWHGKGGDRDTRLRHARRHALGLACILADEREGNLVGFDGADRVETWPGWEADQQAAPGQTALLWLDEAPGMASRVSAEARATVDGSVVLRFGSLAAALDAAFDVLDRAVGTGLAPLLCVDLEPAVPNLADTRLARIQPATPPGKITATAWAAAELALLRDPGLKFTGIGRVRSRRRLGRLAFWSVRRGAAWA